MITLVANLGSTSFKYKLFDMSEGRELVLATGSADRIGASASGGEASAWEIETGDVAEAGSAALPDHAAAIELHLAKLRDMGVSQVNDLSAIGFKAVHGGPISGAVRVDDEVLETMQRFAPIAPAHNPPYIAAMKSFREKLPHVEQVAAFETAFHQTIPLYRAAYAVPYEWIEAHGVRRYGFHGASHRYIATRTAELAAQHGFAADRVISCHLGGSSSISAILRGESVANSFGTTPQSGVFHNNRVGDFDPYALKQLEAGGVSIDDAFQAMSKQGGLLGLSGVSGDMRDVEAAAAQGDARARLALDAFVDVCRRYIGSYMAVLGGVDAIVFTGGIGQHAAAVRGMICEGFEYAGVEIDRAKNDDAKGDEETRLDAESSRAAVWVVPTNEELIVARQTVETLSASEVGG